MSLICPDNSHYDSDHYDPPVSGMNPANTGHSCNIVSRFDQRLPRWANIETALGECLVFTDRRGRHLHSASLIVHCVTFSP